MNKESKSTRTPNEGCSDSQASILFYFGYDSQASILFHFGYGRYTEGDIPGAKKFFRGAAQEGCAHAEHVLGVIALDEGKHVSAGVHFTRALRQGFDVAGDHFLEMTRDLEREGAIGNFWKNFTRVAALTC